MELFENIYSLWALALVLLCAGNGLFFLGYVTQPNWLWKQTVSVPVSSSTSSKSQEKKSLKKNSKKLKASKNKTAKKEEDGSRKDGQRSSTGLSSDSDIPTSNKDIKQIPSTSRNQNKQIPSSETVSNAKAKKSSTKSGSSKPSKQEQSREIAADTVEASPVIRNVKQARDTVDGKATKLAADKKNIPSSKQQPIPLDEEVTADKPQTGVSTGLKKQRKKKAKKQSTASDSAITTQSFPKSAANSQGQQASDNDSQEEWNVVSSDGKAKRPKATTSKSAVPQFSADTSARSMLEKFALSVDNEMFSDSQPPEVASLVDVFDWSLAELKEKEAQYHEKLGSSSSSLDKIINARIVGIPDTNESNGFAASAAVASVHHHLKRKLMGDGKVPVHAGGALVDESVQSSKPNQFANLQQAQQLAYEHQIRTSEIQQEFLKSTNNSWGRMAAGGFGTSSGVPMRQHETAELCTTVGGGAWGEQATGMPRYSQTLQSSFEFVPQRNLSDSGKMIGVDCDEGSIALRRRNSADFAAAERASYEKAVEESRASDSTEEEYSVIDTVISSEFSRRNNSNASLIDAVEDSIPSHEFTFDDGHIQATDDEHLDDIDLIDEFTMASLSSLPSKPADTHFESTAKAVTADVVDDSTINSSLTFHGREHVASFPQSCPATTGMPSSNLSCQKESKGAAAELLSEGGFYTMPAASSPGSTIMSNCHPWMPSKLTHGNTDQVKNGFVTYKTHKQFAILEAMRAMQARQRGESRTMISTPLATSSLLQH